MSHSFPASEFDDWAESYDNAVTTDQFPFYGYPDVLTRVVTMAAPRPDLSVLDLGTGTGNLAIHFARVGCELWCTDFSRQMLAKAQQKLPAAHFVLHDLRAPLPAKFDRQFDCIVSAYVFHHFPLDEKIHILRGLFAHLAPSGRLVIGDIAFPDAASRDRVREQAGENWDEEYYWLADESLEMLCKAGMQACYEQVSSCAGVFVVLPDG